MQRQLQFMPSKGQIIRVVCHLMNWPAAMNWSSTMNWLTP